MTGSPTAGQSRRSARFVRVSLGVLLVSGLALACREPREAPVAGELSEGSLDSSAFDPSQGESVRFSYTLYRRDAATVQVWDPDGGLVRTLVDDEVVGPGKHTAVWDGRDLDGGVVPDEAYTFTVETESGEPWDPTTFSGGVVGDLTDASFQSDGAVVYRLPAAARVLVRLGIRNGPMLKTLVDWQPRLEGTVTEYWNGKDEDGLVSLRDENGFTALITYVTLPDATVVTYGNERLSYSRYKLGPAVDRPSRPERPRRPDPEVRLRPLDLVPPAWSRAPRMTMTFPELSEEEDSTLTVLEGTVSEVRGAIAVRIDVAREDKELLLRDQFEIIFYVDHVFFAEAERGYLPFNWLWELHQLPPGEHLLTANISSMNGQVGVKSRRVRVAGGADASTR